MCGTDFSRLHDTEYLCLDVNFSVFVHVCMHASMCVCVHERERERVTVLLQFFFVCVSLSALCFCSMLLAVVLCFLFPSVLLEKEL